MLITGGSGFIGSHAVDAIIEAGKRVVVLDDGSNNQRQWEDARRGNSGIMFHRGSVCDRDAVHEAAADCGLVLHLAANAHIDKGVADPAVDLDVSVRGTRNVLEAMRYHGIPDLLFASSGAVYGNLGAEPCREAAGPLLPLSPYGAGKVAAEAVLSAYASVFGIRTWIYRFGNVLGPRMTRGAIHDFLQRLDTSPEHLQVLGDGRQTKSYVLVEDCLAGIFWIRENLELPDKHPVRICNLGNAGGTSVSTIARIVLEEWGSPDLPIRYSGGGPQPFRATSPSSVWTRRPCLQRDGPRSARPTTPYEQPSSASSNGDGGQTHERLDTSSGSRWSLASRSCDSDESRPAVSARPCQRSGS